MRKRESRLEQLEKTRATGRERIFIRYDDPALHRHPEGWFLDGEPTDEKPQPWDTEIVVKYADNK